MHKLIYRLFVRSGVDQLVWKLDSRRLRILCYHGVCADRLAEEPWVPRYFVTQTAFERQLQYLQRNAQVLPLRQAVEHLRDGTLPPRSVSITFDDGYANNLRLAYPLLRKYGLPATIFLSSSYIESGDLFPFLKLSLIRLTMDGTGADLGALLNYKTNPLDQVEQSAAPWWADVRRRLTHDQIQVLQPMTIADVTGADSALIDFGAHSHTHCIFRNETQQRSQTEIQKSVEKITQWTGRRIKLFSYPNGERGDFGPFDKEALRAAGVEAAVTGIGGANSSRSELLELRRYPVSLYHTDESFCAEVTGFRSTFLTVAGRLAS